MDTEMLARILAARMLRAPDWADRLDEVCRGLHDAAEHPAAPGPHAPETLRAIAARAEAILRHIAASDALTVGRLYFDLLPRDPAHPLAAAVTAALGDGRAVLRMLRDSGLRLDVRKDDAGTSFVTIHDMERAQGLSDGFRAAILEALALTAQLAAPPRGRLHPIH